MLPYKTTDGKRQQGSTLLVADKTIHSAKPAEMYDIIEKVSGRDGLQMIELFARNKRDGWDSWGNEVLE
jgi:N6-adenosine-specific RNA methylase IME4